MKFKNTVLLTLGTVTAVTAAAAVISKKQDISGYIPEGFTLTAHTGCDGTRLNSLDSITAGFVAGADIVEFDVSFNKEKTAVLSHGEPQGNEVTLCEALNHVSKFKPLKVNADIKSADDFLQIEEIARANNMLDRIFFTGIKESFLDALAQSKTVIPYYLNLSVDCTKKSDSEYLDTLVSKVKDSGAIGINTEYHTCSKELVEKFRENGLLVSIWTVSNRFDMKKALSLGADNITTKKPTAFKEVISAVKGEATESTY